jgi:hypothetical protein
MQAWDEHGVIVSRDSKAPSASRRGLGLTFLLF